MSPAVNRAVYALFAFCAVLVFASVTVHLLDLSFSSHAPHRPELRPVSQAILYPGQTFFACDAWAVRNHPNWREAGPILSVIGDYDDAVCNGYVSAGPGAPYSGILVFSLHCVEGVCRPR